LDQAEGRTALSEKSDGPSKSGRACAGCFTGGLRQIALEGDLDHLRSDRPLRDQLDIDSYDFLQLVIALHERLGVDSPEADYQRPVTLQGALDYLNAAGRSVRRQGLLLTPG